MLFGVSMQADGVTKVVSQKLENALPACGVAFDLRVAKAGGHAVLKQS